jgi:hypothetical protein
MGAWYIYSYLRSRLRGAVLKAVTLVIAAGIFFSAFSDYGYFKRAFMGMDMLDITISVMNSRPRL